MPPKAEDLCLFVSDREGEFKATIKEYRGQTETAWKVRRYHPAVRDYTLKKKDFGKCQVVVGIYKRRCGAGHSPVAVSRLERLSAS